MGLPTKCFSEGTAVIRLACPSCSQKLAVEDASAGTVCKCPACDSKFRVPDVEPTPASVAPSPRSQPTKRSANRDSSGGQREAGSRTSATGSGAGSGSRRDKNAAAGAVMLDELEVVNDETEVVVRRKTKKARREPTPQWVYLASAVGGVLLCGLVAAGFYYKYVAIALIVIGLPVSLMSRKWYLFGGVGVGYLLSGAILFLLHNSVLKHLEGPPPKGSTAQMVDAHCSKLLRDSREYDASSWIGAEKPTDSTSTRNMRNLIQGAYKAGAAKVCVANTQRVDSVGLPFPDLIVVLPDDETAKDRVLAWYKRLSTFKRDVPVAGEKYLYVDY
jgi:hypothetical protein